MTKTRKSRTFTSLATSAYSFCRPHHGSFKVSPKTIAFKRTRDWFSALKTAFAGLPGRTARSTYEKRECENNLSLRKRTSFRSVNQSCRRLRNKCTVGLGLLKPQLNTTARGSASPQQLHNHKTNLQYRLPRNVPEQHVVVTPTTGRFWCHSHSLIW